MSLEALPPPPYSDISAALLAVTVKVPPRLSSEAFKTNHDRKLMRGGGKALGVSSRRGSSSQSSSAQRGMTMGGAEVAGGMDGTGSYGYGYGCAPMLEGGIGGGAGRSGGGQTFPDDPSASVRLMGSKIQPTHRPPPPPAPIVTAAASTSEDPFTRDGVQPPRRSSNTPTTPKQKSKPPNPTSSRAPPTPTYTTEPSETSEPLPPRTPTPYPSEQTAFPTDPSDPFFDDISGWKEDDALLDVFSSNAAIDEGVYRMLERMGGGATLRYECFDSCGSGGSAGDKSGKDGKDKGLARRRRRSVRFGVGKGMGEEEERGRVGLRLRGSLRKMHVEEEEDGDVCGVGSDDEQIAPEGMKSAPDGTTSTGNQKSAVTETGATSVRRGDEHGVGPPYTQGKPPIHSTKKKHHHHAHKTRSEQPHKHKQSEYNLLNEPPLTTTLVLPPTPSQHQNPSTPSIPLLRRTPSTSDVLVSHSGTELAPLLASAGSTTGIPALDACTRPIIRPGTTTTRSRATTAGTTRGRVWASSDPGGWATDTRNVLNATLNGYTSQPTGSYPIPPQYQPTSIARNAEPLSRPRTASMPSLDSPYHPHPSPYLPSSLSYPEIFPLASEPIATLRKRLLFSAQNSRLRSDSSACPAVSGTAGGVSGRRGTKSARSGRDVVGVVFSIHNIPQQSKEKPPRRHHPR
ncbi:hypothetical protein HK097_010368 [Rhizophlyctis rosea]|uniref:Uncharacterized protein n=1 Tax=Rhizophlyctis rosea TaxID=64517 RepID=A0AAD5X3W5_9FUNG|nr:hypothetical protein HK097_010368 [Rhizophlyctis rosea]